MRFNVKEKPLGNTPADRCCNWKAGTCIGFGWTWKADRRGAVIAKPVKLGSAGKPCAEKCNWFRKVMRGV